MKTCFEKCKLFLTKNNMSIERINPTQRWSDATVFNGTCHFVEVPGATEGVDIHQQTASLLASAEANLARCRSDKSRLLQATIFLTNFTNLAAFNAAWDAWLPAGAAPSRACVKAELVDPNMLVEVAFVAAQLPT